MPAAPPGPPARGTSRRGTSRRGRRAAAAAAAARLGRPRRGPRAWRWLGLLAAARARAAAAAGPAPCRALQRLDGRHCFGLEAEPAGAAGQEACEARCCEDDACEVWQFHPAEGCFRGRPFNCGSGHGGYFARDAVGARLREPSGAPGEITHSGLAALYSDTIEVEPFAESSEDYFYFELEAGPAFGELFRARRTGPRAADLAVWQYCWPQERQPPRCCHSAAAAACWRQPAHRAACCGGGGRGGIGEFFRAGDLGDRVLDALHALVPKVHVDREAFEAKRRRWRMGREAPRAACPCRVAAAPASRGPRAAAGAADSADAAGAADAAHATDVADAADAADAEDAADAADDVASADTGTTVWLVMRALVRAGEALSGTFVNVGAGRCESPDPMFVLLHSDEGRGLAGLAVDANASDLASCASALANSSARVVPVPLALEPPTAAARLRPHLAALAPGAPAAPGAAQVASPIPLDVLVVDIDGYDCLVADELLHVAEPKILVIELAFHIPPPFRFSMHYDPARSTSWLQEYDVQRLDPLAGCSLSYAVHMLRRRQLWLLRLTHTDAVFVHDSVAPAVGEAFKVTFPQDEIECFRRSRVWSMLPGSFVREWFFDPHPATSFGRIFANLTALGAELGRAGAPFALDF